MCLGGRGLSWLEPPRPVRLGCREPGTRGVLGRGVRPQGGRRRTLWDLCASGVRPPPEEQKGAQEPTPREYSGNKGVKSHPPPAGLLRCAFELTL